MTRGGLARNSATFLAMIVAGFFLGTYLDQRFTSGDAEYQVASIDRPEVMATGKFSSACAGEDGPREKLAAPERAGTFAQMRRRSIDR